MSLTKYDLEVFDRIKKYSKMNATKYSGDLPYFNKDEDNFNNIFDGLNNENVEESLKNLHRFNLLNINSGDGIAQEFQVTKVGLESFE